MSVDSLVETEWSAKYDRERGTGMATLLRRYTSRTARER